MKTSKRTQGALILFLIEVVLACGGEQSQNQTGPKIALVVNQRFGDKGPMDDMDEGAKKLEQEYGLKIKRLESDSLAAHEEDVMAMAQEGYELIITTFPYMTEATLAAAKAYPQTMFAAIFQFINVGGESVPNIWDTEYHGEKAFFMLGALASILTETNKIGIIIGAEEPSPNAEGNAFMRGALATNKDIVVQFAYVGSYEDPAKAKEIARAMIASGVDVIQCDAGKSQLGAIEAAREAGILVSGDVADNYALYPQGFYGYVGISFGANAYKAGKDFIEGRFAGGEHGIMDLDNQGYYIPWEAFERFADEQNRHADKITQGLKTMRDLEAQMKAGSLDVAFDTQTPNWNRIQGEKN